MKTYTKFIAMLGLSTMLAAPAFSAGHSMDVSDTTCADFTSMDEDGQMAAAEALIERLGSRQNADAARIRLNEICGGNEGSTRIITAATVGMTMDQ